MPVPLVIGISGCSQSFRIGRIAVEAQLGAKRVNHPRATVRFKTHALHAAGC